MGGGYGKPPYIELDVMLCHVGQVSIPAYGRRRLWKAALHWARCDG